MAGVNNVMPRRGDVRESDGYFYYSRSRGKDGSWCEYWLPYEEFARRVAHRKAYKKAHQAAVNIERRKILDKIKLDSGCIDCGYNECAVALDFDHLIPKDKHFGISRQAASVSWKRLMAEIKKCVIRCANCHRIKTHEKGEHLCQTQ